MSPLLISIGVIALTITIAWISLPNKKKTRNNTNPRNGSASTILVIFLALAAAIVMTQIETADPVIPQLSRFLSIIFGAMLFLSIATPAMNNRPKPNHPKSDD